MTAEPVSVGARTCVAQTFTVIHGGDEIDQDRELDLLAAVSAWAGAAEPGVTRVVDVWGAPWNRLISSCVATAIAFGGPICGMPVPVVDDLVARMRARGLVVRHRQARPGVVADAELRAISQGWPVRYI